MMTWVRPVSALGCRKRGGRYPQQTYKTASPSRALRHHSYNCWKWLFSEVLSWAPYYVSVSAGEWSNGEKEVRKDQCMIKNEPQEIHAGLVRFSP